MVFIMPTSQRTVRASPIAAGSVNPGVVRADHGTLTFLYVPLSPTRPASVHVGDLSFELTTWQRIDWPPAENMRAGKMVMGHAFRFVRNVVFLVDPGNRRSQRAIEKIGAVRAGSRLDGAGRESFVYRIESSSFLESG